MSSVYRVARSSTASSRSSLPIIQADHCAARRGTLGTKVDAIETGPGYQCRTRDSIVGAKISAHAKGIAIDLMAVRFADKRRVAWEHQDSASEASYIRRRGRRLAVGLQQCSDREAIRFHANHMHLDTESHGSNGSYRICQ